MMLERHKSSKQTSTGSQVPGNSDPINEHYYHPNPFPGISREISLLPQLSIFESCFQVTSTPLRHTAYAKLHTRLSGPIMAVSSKTTHHAQDLCTVDRN